MSGLYSSVAPFYDRLGEHLDFKKYAAFVSEMKTKYSQAQNNIVLDLACGTGSLSIPLSKVGYDVIASDISCEMLSEAKHRAESEGADILFINQDMRYTDLFGTAGLVVCATDAINHLLSTDDLRLCFSGVSKFLDFGGLFIFDINTVYRFENEYSDHEFVLEDEGIFCTLSCSWEPKRAVCDFSITLFTEKGGMWERADEFLRERCWSERTLKKLLNSAGLETIQIYKDLDVSAKKGDEGRIFWVCKKI